MDILNYYPILFVVGFLAMIFVMYKDSAQAEPNGEIEEERSD